MKAASYERLMSILTSLSMYILKSLKVILDLTSFNVIYPIVYAYCISNLIINPHLFLGKVLYRKRLLPVPEVHNKSMKAIINALLANGKGVKFKEVFR